MEVVIELLLKSFSNMPNKSGPRDGDRPSSFPRGQSWIMTCKWGHADGGGSGT